MSITLASWLLIAVAVLLANLPFLTDNLFGVIPRRSPKPLWLRMVELALFYVLVGLLARLLEGRIGSVFAQSKEFYMLTVPLFVTLAFPGFVLRYLSKRSR
ncbi:DUF2818 family protein [Massilia sp. DWR3-1-1]|jgi:hypothetical protein|uniref:DUF2818 family protein n=1 Tax=Massilia sp. DWR3-1-1 TaxID=2804559 RepID=UPI003CE82B57